MSEETEKEKRRLAKLEQAWVVIANAGGGNWDKETKEWREAAIRFREAYHDELKEPVA